VGNDFENFEEHDEPSGKLASLVGTTKESARANKFRQDLRFRKFPERAIRSVMNPLHSRLKRRLQWRNCTSLTKDKHGSLVNETIKHINVNHFQEFPV